MEVLKKTVISAATFVVCWLSLSYMFFPIKLYAPPAEYFRETVTHMVPIKLIITIIFILLIIFLYERHTNTVDK